MGRNLGFALLAFFAFGCASKSSDAPAVESDAGADADAGPPAAASKIEHVVIVVQENHTFDAYFGKYCTATTGSNPTCTAGPACCEAGPDKEPGGASPTVLDDTLTGARDPDHSQSCELTEMNGGKMDKYTVGCGDPRNFVYADPTLIKPYHDLAGANALADRYFQPIVGQSSSNDMYLARAKYVFTDNAFVPDSAGLVCTLTMKTAKYTDPTIADLLVGHGVSWAWYGEGYQAMLDAKGTCPTAPTECLSHVQLYPCLYDPSDVPFQYYPSLTDNPKYMRDFAQLATDMAAGTMPAVSFVKAYGYKSEHPGYMDKLSDGVTFVTGVVSQIAQSTYASNTLVLVTYDEGGGYFDHVPPPPASAIDGQGYGTRVPLLAIGPFARKSTVSHVIMEHSSIVKFIEWNWLGATGQLGTRDTVVNNIGSLLDPAATGTAVPEN